MATNNKDILGLGPLMPEHYTPVESTYLITGEADALSQDFSTIGEGTLRQKMVMDAIASKVRHGSHCTAGMVIDSLTSFDETAKMITTANKAAQSESHAQFMDAYTLRLMQVYARFNLGLLAVGALKITQEVHRPLLPPPSSEPPSFLKRLFG